MRIKRNHICGAPGAVSGVASSYIVMVVVVSVTASSRMLLGPVVSAEVCLNPAAQEASRLPGRPEEYVNDHTTSWCVIITRKTCRERSFWL